MELNWVSVKNVAYPNQGYTEDIHAVDCMTFQHGTCYIMQHSCRCKGKKSP